MIYLYITQKNTRSSSLPKTSIFPPNSCFNQIKNYYILEAEASTLIQYININIFLLMYVIIWFLKAVAANRDDNNGWATKHTTSDPPDSVFHHLLLCSVFSSSLFRFGPMSWAALKESTCSGVSEWASEQVKRMFRSARWRSDKNRVKAVFKLHFHATQVPLIFLRISYFFLLLLFLLRNCNWVKKPDTMFHHQTCGSITSRCKVWVKINND